MKKSISVILSACIIMILASCSTTIVGSKPLPPGQAKKVTGSQSAKSYAPGQQKKTTASSGNSASGQKKKKK